MIVDAHTTLEAFLSGRPDPGITLVAPGWGSAYKGGSPNLAKIEASAAYGYEIPEARDRWIELGGFERTEFMLGEPYGVTYSNWHFLPTLNVLGLAEERQDREVIAAVHPMVMQWLGAAKLMAYKVPRDPALKDPELKLAGQSSIAWAGCRSWGHNTGIVGGQHLTLRVALGEQDRFEGDGWTELCLRRWKDLLRSLMREYAALSPEGIVAKMPRYTSRMDFEFRLYEDGSRVHIMGTDEPELRDEDENGNTLGFLAFVADLGRGLVQSFPEWPAPNSGATRIRQQSVKADIDRHPSGKGWLLRHELIGRRKVGDFWETDIPEPESRLVAAWRAPMRGADWINLLAPAPPPPPTNDIPRIDPAKRRERWYHGWD